MNLKFDKLTIHSIAKVIVVTFILFSMSYNQQILAQNRQLETQWWQQSYETSGFVGVGLLQFIEKSKKISNSVPITIAILDTGLDTTHAIINSFLWRNKNEIAGNNFDDDRNGYIDDVVGWNFLGGKNQNIEYAQPEAVREYVRLKAKMKNSDKAFTNSELNYWKTLETKYTQDKNSNEKKLKEYIETLLQYQQISQTLQVYGKVLSKKFEDSIITYSQIKNWKPISDSLKTTQAIYLSILEAIDTTLHVAALQNEFKDAIPELQKLVNDYQIAVGLYDTEKNFRAAIGDSLDVWQSFYGNNQISDNNGHGTSVAGIICVGLDACLLMGMQQQIKIMPVRIVPSGGDEYDKDVANGIRYAVDNGAKIINMSFGKYYSPNAKWVDDAILYGISKGVLFIHAAGNESFDLDTKNHFPVPPKKAINSWIEVGASGQKADENLLASFSNYGKNSVDVFAPGVELDCPAPNNTWQITQGTSLAAPIVSLCAALLWTKNPDAKPEEIKKLIVENAKTYTTNVYLKRTKKNVKFNQLSKSGGVVALPLD